jgi:hypothetical protein
VSDSKPSLIRTQALDEYELLRRTLDELDHLTARLLAEGSSAVSQTLAVASKLLRELSAHVDVQRLCILPTVRLADVWGDVRADLLAKDHTDRCEDLRAIEFEYGGAVDARALAADLEEFSLVLRADLKRQEQGVLHTDALRDDVVETDPD